MSDIDKRVERIKKLEDVHKKRLRDHRLSDKISYWVFLGVVLAINFVLSLLIVFLIVFLDNPLLYVIIVILGLSFGLIYEVFLNGMKHIFLHHHIFAKLFVAVTAGINIFYIVFLTRFAGLVFNLTRKTENVIAYSIVYFVCFIAPYFVVKIFKS